MRALIGAMLIAAMTVSVVAQEIASDWIDGERHRLRVFAGAVPDAAPGTVTAFVEMTLDKGWKTYWMNPGTAGGIPPEFSFEGSTNVAKAEVLFPLPQVMSDKAGDVIGYREFAIFPLRITPADGAKPVGLEVTINYGICEKLCVPAETRVSLVIPPAPLPAAGPDAERAYASVPRTATNLKPGDPSAFKAERQAGEPQTIVDPSGGTGRALPAVSGETRRDGRDGRVRCDVCQSRRSQGAERRNRHRRSDRRKGTIGVQFRHRLIASVRIEAGPSDNSVIGAR